ncbi:hypothetical protein AZE42_03384 [Rhizopogon vesiculosus]|uniref:Uncharacterized protein n=1 Tax=Rhizopogon vesiculosus TaxID=180088 RepID=A0A1J8PVC3_9AGAM|nr:hypothetical protein AZE42_03384 [Rhizopogon vesiculosus]
MFEDDQDSLFGSPPPSPIRGRSPALPPQAAQEKGRGITQNVGTIALPGSHMSCSELPAELPVLPLGGTSIHELPRLYVQPSQSTLQWRCTQSPRAASSAPSSSASSSISRPTSSVTRKRKSTKSKSSTPRPEPPPIMFPGPDDPLPSNFLRSQKALLGIAGLVGDIKPTNLPHQTLQGSTPCNPIVVEESPQCQLSPLNGEDVITSLIRQQNIFPVLSSILKLMGNSPDPLGQPTYTHSFSRPYGAPLMTGPPPLKRRKLTSVPAGAVDWDVPYPFPEGEGPESYHATWEQDRARHLIVQLFEMIKNAVHGAAARKHTRKTKVEMRKQKLEDERQGSMSKESSGGTESSRFSTVEPTSERSLSAGVEAPTDSLDQLLASLLSGVPSNPQDPPEVPNTPPGEALPQFDEALFDSWLAELQALPPPECLDEAMSVTPITPITPVTPVPSLDDLIRSNSNIPPASTPSVQSTQNSNPVVPRRAIHKPIEKEAILQRARERRRQIVAEIERAKVELWETSIEGGVLGHLIKDPTLS